MTFHRIRPAAAIHEAVAGLERLLERLTPYRAPGLLPVKASWGKAVYGIMGGAFLAVCSPAALAEEPDRGRLLYENHCTSCHESVVHIRQDRKARSLQEVTWQITRWAAVQNLDWRYDEVRDVLGYLNAHFYRFAEPREK
jgi:mono/diheme cytochrome c family protein